MKTISAEAMAAIEAGEAIVTGAVEFYTPGRGPIGVPEATDVVLTWQQLGDTFLFLPSTGTMGLTFYDSVGTVLSTIDAPAIATAPGVWTFRSLSTSTPADATRVRVRMGGARNAGVEIRVGWDAISLTIGGTSVPLTNPGAELGTTVGWQSEFNDDDIIVVTFAQGADAYAGEYLFFGGENNIAAFYQDVYLSEVIPVEPGVVEAALRVWGGHGPIEIDGAEYLGIGDRGLAQQTGGAIGGIAQGLELTLSGIEPANLVLSDADEIRGGSVVLRRLIFASDGKTLLDYDIWDRGRVDTVSTVEKIGGEAVIKVGVESAARGLGRAGARMRSDSDQRLINPNDGYFRFCSYAGEKMLYWGGKKPSRVGGSTFIGNPSSGGI